MKKWRDLGPSKLLEELWNLDGSKMHDSRKHSGKRSEWGYRWSMLLRFVRSYQYVKLEMIFLMISLASMVFLERKWVEICCVLERILVKFEKRDRLEWERDGRELENRWERGDLHGSMGDLTWIHGGQRGGGISKVNHLFSISFLIHFFLLFDVGPRLMGQEE